MCFCLLLALGLNQFKDVWAVEECQQEELRSERPSALGDVCSLPEDSFCWDVGGGLQCVLRHETAVASPVT